MEQIKMNYILEKLRFSFQNRPTRSYAPTISRKNISFTFSSTQGLCSEVVTSNLDLVNQFQLTSHQNRTEKNLKGFQIEV